MTKQFVLRDVTRIILPFSLFVGIFSHGAVSAASLALGALCLWSEISNGLRRVPAMTS